MSDKKIFEEKYRELAKNFKDYKYFRGENKKGIHSASIEVIQAGIR